MDTQRPDAFVSGALAFVLQVSRLAGVAPLRFVKQRGGWRVSLSPHLHVYGCVLVTIMNSMTVITLIKDLLAEPAHSIRMQTITKSIVWIFDVLILLSLVFHGAYAAPKHLKAVIACLNQLQMINNELDVPHWPKEREKMKCILLSLWMALTITVTMIDYYMQSMVIQKRLGNVLLCIMYLFFYLCYWIMQLLVYQFVLMTLHICQSFIKVNDKLKTLSQAMSNSKNVLIQSSIIQDVFTVNKKPKKTMNAVIDNLAFVGKAKPADFTEPAQESVRRLALTYLKICGVVREMDKRHGTMLMLLLSCFVLHMILAPYHVINNVFGSNENKGMLYISIQCVWSVYHYGNIMMLIEPCHLTLQEMGNTRVWISQLLLQTNSSQPLAEELDLFFRIICLNKVSYSPLQITTLTRSLVATILGTIVTYLAVIIQL